MSVLLKEESSDIDSALNDLISFESALTHIALHSDTVALEAFDIGKVKDTVVKAFKAFWKRITELYTRFVKWLKGKFGYGDMKGDVADAKKDVNKKTSDEVRAAEQNQVFETSDGKPATVKGFIGEINDIVAKHLPKSAAAVIESLEQYREGASDDQKSLLSKIIDYYRKFFICYGSGDELLDTEAISDIAKLINDDINGARKAFFDFIKLPAGTSVEILTRKIETFRGLGLFGKIADVLKPYVDSKSEGDRLSVLSDMLPQVSKIQELDFSKIKKVKKDPALDESLIGFLAARSNETLDKLLVTISAYEEISGVIEEQADEFSKLKSDVIMPGSTLEEVRPYIDTATAFSKVQTALTKLMLHQYTAEMALVNATVALRDSMEAKLTEAKLAIPERFRELVEAGNVMGVQNYILVGINPDRTREHYLLPKLVRYAKKALVDQGKSLFIEHDPDSIHAKKVEGFDSKDTWSESVWTDLRINLEYHFSEEHFKAIYQVMDYLRKKGHPKFQPRVK